MVKSGWALNLQLYEISVEICLMLTYIRIETGQPSKLLSEESAAACDGKRANAD